MSNAPQVPPGDLELREFEVPVIGGAVLVVREFTLRQRDTLVDHLEALADDETREILSNLFGISIDDLFGPDEDEKPEETDSGALVPKVLDEDEREGGVDVYVFVQNVAKKIGRGSFTRILAVALDNVENREHWKTEGKPTLDDAYDWIADHVSLSQEVSLIEAIVRANDLEGYLGNLWGLLPIKVEKQGTPNDAKLDDET